MNLSIDEHSHSNILLFDEIDGYRIIKQIGQGGCGYIYFVRNIQTNQPFAMKFAQKDSQKQILDIEKSVMSEIQDDECFPKLIQTGTYESQDYIIMELLGPSLDAIRKILPAKRLSLQSTILVGLQTINIIKAFHMKGFVHRDIKASNFLLKQKSERDLCLIDFGLSKRHIDPMTSKPHEFQRNVSFVGTPRYCSLNAHKNMDLGRCDDLISWFYMLLDMCLGTLPWMAVTDKELVQLMKERTTNEELCKGLPSEFKVILDYLETLKYADEPDYCFVSNKLRQALNSIDGDINGKFDWELLPANDLSAISCISFKRTLSDSFQGHDETLLTIPKKSPSRSVLPNSGEGEVEKVLLSSPDNDSHLVHPITDEKEPSCFCCSLL